MIMPFNETSATLKQEQTHEQRSRAYKLIAIALGYPDEELIALIEKEHLLVRLRETLTSLDLAAHTPLPDQALITCGAEAKDLEDSYLRLFEVGGSGRPICPLHAGQHSNTERTQVMEECLRFYNHFGLKLNQSDGEMPDFIGTQLEFLHVLAFYQASAARDGSDASNYQRAERDFVSRQVLNFVRQTIACLKDTDVPECAYYLSLFTVLEAILSSLTVSASNHHTIVAPD